MAMAMHLSETFSIIEPSTTTLRSLHSILCILETIPILRQHIFGFLGAHPTPLPYKYSSERQKN